VQVLLGLINQDYGGAGHVAGDPNDELYQLSLTTAELIEAMLRSSFDFDGHGKTGSIDGAKILGASENQAVYQFATETFSPIVQPSEPHE
jgi:hypothetical protein